MTLEGRRPVVRSRRQLAAADDEPPGAPEQRAFTMTDRVEQKRTAMPGTYVTDHRIRLFTSKRKHSRSRRGNSWYERASTARRIEHNGRLPSHNPPRIWRTRSDPFADVWGSEVVPLLRHAPRLKAFTLLCRLQEAHPGLFPDSSKVDHHRDARFSRCARRHRESGSAQPNFDCSQCMLLFRFIQRLSASVVVGSQARGRGRPSNKPQHSTSPAHSHPNDGSALPEQSIAAFLAPYPCKANAMATFARFIQRTNDARTGSRKMQEPCVANLFSLATDA